MRARAAGSSRQAYLALTEGWPTAQTSLRHKRNRGIRPVIDHHVAALGGNSTASAADRERGRKSRGASVGQRHVTPLLDRRNCGLAWWLFVCRAPPGDIEVVWGFPTKTVVGVSPTGLIDFSVGVSPTEIRYEPPLEFCFHLTTCSWRARAGLQGAEARLAAIARACAASIVSTLRQSSVGAASLVCL
jgi:hypothetical protein